VMEQAAEQGHAYAMDALGLMHSTRNEHVLALEWSTKGAETGLPKAMYNHGQRLDKGGGVAAPDGPAAADWYRRAADAGHGAAASNLSTLYNLGRGMA